MRREKEKGAVAVLVAILMVALLGMGALAVDIGRIAAEKAQLQNGADASALAVAQYCSNNAGNCTALQAQSLANQYTPPNSNDGTAVAAPPILQTTAAGGTVQTRTSTPPDGLPLTLGRIFGMGSTPVEAAATAEWGFPSSGGGFPLALSNSCFDLSSGSETGDLQRFSYKPGNGPNGTPSQMQCTKNSSGATVSGGWGWLSESSPCYATTTSGGWAGGDPGNDPGDCKSILEGWVADLTAGKNVEQEFPVFDYSAGTGNGSSYKILGYATFEIHAWQFSGTGNQPYTYMPSTIPSNVKCSGSNRCIVGKFMRFEEADPSALIGGSNYGTTIVRLIK
ncbi:TadE/TadG family type IV pilus assembly protein [Sinomonas cellulolyticus]|uniref:Tad domain-containing protein n=1 Tax=Sinomonas cellulolyticus TaxID=2801916 RepID=A0ABS1JZH3_9MICC|nr:MULTISPECIES: TadE/TadG family type IV pilus assembly protein [Sinomonas]MBL0704650.1 Tad domain-containing protein [Sinomonas cellulolyticus]